MMMHMHHAAVDPTTLPCACTSLRKTARAVSRLYDLELADAGMNANQLAILRALARGGPAPLSRLAETMVLDRTSLYRGIEPMVRRGWIAVSPASTGRTRIAALTDPGRAAMDAAAPSWEAAQRRFVEAFGPGEWRDLHAALHAALRSAGTAAAAATTPAGR
jgi:DNA-binding MarR family transcriptional regulator